MPGRFRVLAFCAAVTLLASGISVASYSPRFVYWRGLGIAGVTIEPEVFRANDAVSQLEHPFAPIAEPLNRVLRWRLLFPLVGKALGLGKTAYLAIPHVGCVLALGFVAWVARRDTRNRRAAFASTLLAATSSWFFVSTGWLAYFDSWCVLALLVASFARSWKGLALACFAGPWIDERVVLALPLVLAVRALHARDVRGEPASLVKRETLLAIGCVLPYLVVRGVAFLGADAESRDYVSNLMTWERVAAVPAGKWPRGVWHGLRGLWVFVGALPFLAPAGRSRIPGLVVLVAAAFVEVALAFCVADLSRAMGVLLPAALLGIVAAVRVEPRLARGLLLAACLINVGTPARHVLTLYEVRITPLPDQLEQWKHPPFWLTAPFHIARAERLHEKGDLASALRSLDAALALDPLSVPALLARAKVRREAGDERGAERDLEAAAKLARGD